MLASDPGSCSSCLAEYTAFGFPCTLLLDLRALLELHYFQRGLLPRGPLKALKLLLSNPSSATSQLYNLGRAVNISKTQVSSCVNSGSNTGITVTGLKSENTLTVLQLAR